MKTRQMFGICVKLEIFGEHLERIIDYYDIKTADAPKTTDWGKKENKNDGENLNGLHHFKNNVLTLQ